MQQPTTTDTWKRKSSREETHFQVRLQTWLSQAHIRRGGGGLSSPGPPAGPWVGDVSSAGIRAAVAALLLRSLSARVAAVSSVFPPRFCEVLRRLSANRSSGGFPVPGSSICTLGARCRTECAGACLGIASASKQAHTREHTVANCERSREWERPHV